MEHGVPSTDDDPVDTDSDIDEESRSLVWTDVDMFIHFSFLFTLMVLFFTQSLNQHQFHKLINIQSILLSI